MPEPYNYTFQQPTNGAVQGFAQGLQINQAFQAQQDARQQLELQRAQEAQMRQDLGAVAANPTVASINQVMLKYPTLAEKFKPALESATTQQRDARVARASDVYAALRAGRPEVAKQLLEEHATAYGNSGNQEEAKRSRMLAQMIDVGPEGAKHVLGIAGMYLSSALGPDKFAEAYSKFETTANDNAKAPAELEKVKAETEKVKAETLKAQMETVKPQGELAQQARTLGVLKPDGTIDTTTKAGKDLAFKATHFAPSQYNPLMGVGNGMGVGGAADVETYAKRLLSGAEAWPTAISIRTDPTVAAGIKLARQMDPSFNSATYAQRAATFKAFTVGKQGDTLNKINTAIAHLAEYSDTLEQVPDTGVGFLNSAVNKVRGTLGNVPINQANTIQTTLANELEGAYRASGGTESGIQHMRELLDPNLPLAARRANLATVTSLLQGKEAAMLDQYNRGVGKFGVPLDVITPESQAASDKVLARGGRKAVTPASHPTSQPLSPEEAAKLPSGTRFVGLDGVARVKN